MVKSGAAGQTRLRIHSFRKEDIAGATELDHWTVDKENTPPPVGSAILKGSGRLVARAAVYGGLVTSRIYISRLSVFALRLF